LFAGPSGVAAGVGRDDVNDCTVSAAGRSKAGLRKFVDSLLGLGPGGANNLGQYIPVANADNITHRGSDYYEIAAVQ
jgi:hypothetical protein